MDIQVFKVENGGSSIMKMADLMKVCQLDGAKKTKKKMAGF
jgi:hypothetical protein